MKQASSIRIPSALLEKIDELIKKGYYESRSEFVSASIRYGLIFYADLRVLAVEMENSPFALFAKMSLPKPINEKVSGFELLMDMKPKEVERANDSEKPNEVSIRNYYKSFTTVFLRTFNSFRGEKIQVVFKFPDSLRERSKVMYRMDYGLSRKMDFVKASIIWLVVKLFETDYLYNETDRYMSEMKDSYEDIIFNMIFDFFSGSSMLDTITGTVDGFFDEDDESDGDGEE